jgi:hypothetical protein
MDTTSSIMPEVAPVSYQVNVTKFCVLLNTLATLVHNQQMYISFLIIPFYFQSAPVHSANCVKAYTMTWVCSEASTVMGAVAADIYMAT